MTVFENPSAGKFGPPPENAQRERERGRLGTGLGKRKEWVLAALALAYVGLKLVSGTSTGWTAAIVTLLAALILAAELVVGRQVREERGGPEPYSTPTHITR